MTNLPVQTSEIELPFGVIRYLRKSYPEEPAFPESKRLLQEPPGGYARRKAVAGEGPGHPHRPGSGISSGTLPGRGKAEDDHRLCYHYKTFKVLDQSEEELEQSDNPFALVILATKAALKRENGDYTEEAYFKRKLELVHWLKGRSRSETQPRALLSFLKYYRPLEDPALKHKFDEQLKERNKTMGTGEYLVNEAKEKGREEAREEEIILCGIAAQKH